MKQAPKWLIIVAVIAGIIGTVLGIINLCMR